MGIVTLVPGGLDSTLMAVLAAESGIAQHPLFVDYGQRSVSNEYTACCTVLGALGLSEPHDVTVPGYGALVKSGLTSSTLDVVTDAFTPGRNLLFLLLGASYAHQVSASAVAIGLLDEKTMLFPDQSENFLAKAEQALRAALGTSIRVLAPLRGFAKVDVVALAQSKGIVGTYSCHAGTPLPCGVCIACSEYNFKEV